MLIPSQCPGCLNPEDERDLTFPSIIFPPEGEEGLPLAQIVCETCWDERHGLKDKDPVGWQPVPLNPDHDFGQQPPPEKEEPPMKAYTDHLIAEERKILERQALLLLDQRVAEWEVTDSTLDPDGGSFTAELRRKFSSQTATIRIPWDYEDSDQ